MRQAVPAHGLPKSWRSVAETLPCEIANGIAKEAGPECSPLCAIVNLASRDKNLRSFCMEAAGQTPQKLRPSSISRLVSHRECPRHSESRGMRNSRQSCCNKAYSGSATKRRKERLVPPPALSPIREPSSKPSRGTFWLHKIRR